jgi:N-acetylneuraminic acid mutarotase
VCFVLNNHVYVTGGGGDGFLIQPDLWRYNPSTDSWTALQDFPGNPRQYAFAHTIGNKAYLMGGLTKSGEALNELWEYDPATDHWTEKSSLPGPARFKAVGFVIGNSIYYGSGTNGTLVFKDFWRYNVHLDQWTALPHLPGQGRHEAVAFAHENQAYVGGGIDSNGTHRSELFHWIETQSSWQQLSNMTFSIAFAEAACAAGFCALWDGLVNGEFSGEIKLPVFGTDALDYEPKFSVFSIPGIPLRNTSV